MNRLPCSSPLTGRAAWRARNKKTATPALPGRKDNIMTKEDFFKILDRGHHTSEFESLFIGTPGLIVDFRAPMPIREFDDANSTYPLYVDDCSDTVADDSPLPFRYIIHIPDSWHFHCIPFLEEMDSHHANDDLWMYL